MRIKLNASIFVLLCLFANLIGGLHLKDDENIQLLRRSRQMLSFMNKTVDPCENFYEFTCGNWANVYPAEKDDDMETNFLKKIVDSFDEQVIEMLRIKEDPKDSDFDKKVRNFFQSCLSLKNGVELQSILKVIEEIGKMPALTENDEKWNEDDFDWLDTLAHIKAKYGYQIIIGVDVGPDLKDNSTNRVYIGEAEFELEGKSVYLEPIGEKYREMYILAIAMNLKESLHIGLLNAMSVARRIVDFEVKLAEGMLDMTSDRNLDKLLIKTTADELQQKYEPTIDIKRFLKIVLGEVPEGLIYEYVPGYLQNVKDVIEKAEKRDVADYIFYHLLRRFKIADTETTEKLEKSCLTMVKKQFYKAIDNMFYRRFLNKEVEVGIQELWHTIKDTFKSKLMDVETVEWLTVETREKALEKLEALQLYINTYEDYDFAKDFDNLTIVENDFVGNLQNITEFDTKKTFRKLHEPVSKLETGDKISGTAVNLQAENTIYVPVSMLQPYFLWAVNFPDALKFSLTGFLLAHELIHAFDDSGRQFGKTGNIEEWWDSESTKRFLKLRTCFSDQYHGYIYGKNPLPKSERQSENIADNGGLKLAYDAFILHFKSSDEKVSPSLPDFQYTDKQLFFIGYGQFWCSDIRSELIDLQTATDDHTPGQFRNIGVISNSLDFAEAFNCTVGSKMNPEKKCKIYR